MVRLKMFSSLTVVADGAKFNTLATCSGAAGSENIFHPYNNAKNGTGYKGTYQSMTSSCLVLNENLPRSVWPLGRVLEVYCNHKDGIGRSAKVKTRTSELVRAIDKTVLLETADSANKD